MARYPKVLEYLQHLAANSDRVTFEELGKSTMGHPYVLVKMSSPENLARMDRLVEKYRRQFRIPENYDFYSEDDYQSAERQYLRFCLMRGGC